jgi:hypothetical protein
VWIDASTCLIEITVEKADIETQTTCFSDYRPVDRVRLPFAERSTNGEAKYDQ